MRGATKTTDPFDLRVVRLRAEFVIEEPLLVHALNGPMLRGAFGTALRTLHGKGGLYSLLFDEGGLGGSVRPYRIRAPLGEPANWPAGSLLPFEIDLFGQAAVMVKELPPTLVVMAHLGFGERRSRAKLHAVEQILPSGPVRLLARSLTDPFRLKTDPLRDHLPDVSKGVEFVSPVRLASRGPANPPITAEIVRDVARRLANLSRTPQPSPDASEDWKWQDARSVRENRLSRREGAQALSGVVGKLLPPREPPSRTRDLIAAACVVGVGRHTAMGLGDCRPL